jgi:hypothetical protein
LAAMTAGQPTPGRPPEEAISRARTAAAKHVRTDRSVARFWAFIFGIGSVVLLALCLAGSFNGHNAWVAAVGIGVLMVGPLYATLADARLQGRILASLDAPPRQLRLSSDRLRRSSTDRRVSLHDQTGVLGTARMRRPRILTSLSTPTEVLVFGDVAPGGRVVCVEPRLGLVATLRLAGEHRTPGTAPPVA